MMCHLFSNLYQIGIIFIFVTNSLNQGDIILIIYYRKVINSVKLQTIIVHTISQKNDIKKNEYRYICKYLINYESIYVYNKLQYFTNYVN